jgi:hypothetical protein
MALGVRSVMAGRLYGGGHRRIRRTARDLPGCAKIGPRRMMAAWLHFSSRPRANRMVRPSRRSSKGMPRGVEVDVDFINAELRRRQGGYGRGGRMKIETDAVDVPRAGIRRGACDRRAAGDADSESRQPDGRPRADAGGQPAPAGACGLCGGDEVADDRLPEHAGTGVARETAARVAAGALAKCLLGEFGVECVRVRAELGPVKANGCRDDMDLERCRRAGCLRGVLPGW